MQKTFLAALLCCSLLFTFASAQEQSAEQLQREFENWLRYIQSPRQRLKWEAEQLALTRATWNGQGTYIPLRLLLRGGGEAELGLSDEQKQRLSFMSLDSNASAEWGSKMRQNPTPEFTLTRDAILAEFIPDDPYFERATEEQKNAFREATVAHSSLFFTFMTNEIQETLTPEQMLVVRKMEMQLMSALGIPFPSMFDPLDLTEEQKKEMNKITEELKAEFDRLTLEDAVLKAESSISAYKILEGQTFTNREDFNKAMNEAHRKRRVPSESQRKKAMELQEQGTKLVSLLQSQLMNVLTDEQLMKMQKILDETPEFAKRFLTAYKMGLAAQKMSPNYVPGPDSWRPGDPVPEKFKEKRKQSRFPKSE